MRKVLGHLRKKVEELVAPGVEAIRKLPENEKFERYSLLLADEVISTNYAPYFITGTGLDLFTRIYQAARKLKCRVRFAVLKKKSVAARTDTAKRSITISSALEELAFQKTYGLTHELAHCVLRHGLSRIKGLTVTEQRAVGEMEAEAVTCLVFHRLGVDTTHKSSIFMVHYWLSADRRGDLWDYWRIDAIIAAAEEILQASKMTWKKA